MFIVFSLCFDALLFLPTSITPAIMTC